MESDLKRNFKSFDSGISVLLRLLSWKEVTGMFKAEELHPKVSTGWVEFSSFT